MEASSIPILKAISESGKSVVRIHSAAWKCQLFLDTMLSGFYEFSFSNSDGETYPRDECIRFVL